MRGRAFFDDEAIFLDSTVLVGKSWTIVLGGNIEFIEARPFLPLQQMSPIYHSWQRGVRIAPTNSTGEWRFVIRRSSFHLELRMIFQILTNLFLLKGTQPAKFPILQNESSSRKSGSDDDAKISYLSIGYAFAFRFLS